MLSMVIVQRARNELEDSKLDIDTMAVGKTYNCSKENVRNIELSIQKVELLIKEGLIHCEIARQLSE